MNTDQPRKRRKLRSLCYSELKRFTSCPKQFWLRYNRVDEESVTVETPEAAKGEVVHRVLSGQDHPRRVKKILEKFQAEGILPPETDLVAMEKDCHSVIKIAQEQKKADLSPKTKTEKLFFYNFSFMSKRTGAKDECTLVTKPDRLGEFEEKGKIIPEIIELKTSDKPHSSHLKQLLFAAIVYSRHNLRDKWLSGPVRLVINYASKLIQPEIRFAGQYRLEEYLEKEVQPVIEEINERMETEDFPANVIPGRCKSCPFAAQCDEYQTSLTQDSIL